MIFNLFLFLVYLLHFLIQSLFLKQKKPRKKKRPAEMEHLPFPSFLQTWKSFFQDASLLRFRLLLWSNQCGTKYTQCFLFESIQENLCFRRRMKKNWVNILNEPNIKGETDRFLNPVWYQKNGPLFKLLHSPSFFDNTHCKREAKRIL